MRGDRALARASNLLGYKQNTQQDLSTNTWYDTYDLPPSGIPTKMIVFKVKVVLEGYRRCPDSHDLSECHHMYDLGRHI